MALYRDVLRRQFAKPQDVKVHDIYGVTWDKGEDPTLTRTDASMGMVANVGVDDSVVQNDFDNTPLFGSFHNVVDDYGNVFVRIPKVYIRKVDTEGFKSWQVSLTKWPGFYRPWCFWDFANNKELPYVDVGAHKASRDSSNRLESKPDTYPQVSVNIVNFRTYAENNNSVSNGISGYQQLDIHVVDLLRTLMFVEFATLNLQTVMYGFASGRYGIKTELAVATEDNTNQIIVPNVTAGQYRVGQAISIGTARYGTQIFYGRTITAINDHGAENKAIVFDGAPVNITTGNFLQNTGWKSGFSADIAASSGSIGDNAGGKYPCMYRGIESPYADIFQFVDGINIKDHQAWVCKDSTAYKSNTFAHPYEQLSYINHDVNGYPTAMGYDELLPFAEFPIAIQTSGVSAAKYYCDYYYQNVGELIALFGGCWTDGSIAGPSCWRLHHSSSTSNVASGARLLRKAL